jgi:hypothetical protein
MIESLRHKLSRLKVKLKVFTDSEAGKKLMKILGYLLQVLIVGVIIYQLSVIGWKNFLNSLPSHPLFYLLFLFIYFLLPVSEAIAYRICWGLKWLKSIPIFIHKRIFNKDVMGYSGELVLMQWAVKSLPYEKKQVFRDIRDMNIISSAASTFVALGMLLVLVSQGKIRALDYLFSRDSVDYIVAAVVALVIVLVALKFRKYLFSMPPAVAVPVFLVHSVRMVLIYMAQILQWHTVLPELGLDIWFTFLSINIVISRIPFVPNNELVATGTNIEVARILNAPVAAIAGLFLVHNVLDKIFNFCFFLYFTYISKNTWKSYAVSEIENTRN